MPDKKSDSKAKRLSDKALATRVAKEMALPRVVKSAKAGASARRSKSGFKPNGGTRIEKYGTGTPQVNKKG
jgi:hypothetical protein